MHTDKTLLPQVDQYDKFTISYDNEDFSTKFKGADVGEVISDNGGLKAAHRAAQAGFQIILNNACIFNLALYCTVK